MSVIFTIIGIIKTDISFYFHNPEEQIKNKTPQIRKIYWPFNTVRYDDS